METTEDHHNHLQNHHHHHQQQQQQQQQQKQNNNTEVEPAILLYGLKDITALVGDRVLLKASYMGHPEPLVKWSKAGRELKNNERTSITSGNGISRLLLQNITADDSGKYDVCVENSHGVDCNYASVSVEGPPDPPSGKPCVTIHGDSVIVTWSSSPYDGGKIITGYTVEYSLVGSKVWTMVADNCYSFSFEINGLQPGGCYIFRVRAINVHGYSKPSLDSDIIQLNEQYECSTFEPRIVSLEPGPEFKPRFEVLEELGKGRFGVVHKVIDKLNNQKLAAKFIRCRSPKDRDKVQDEIDIMNLLRHPKLLQLNAAFENPREMIMVMEYISGGELFERVVADDFTLTEKDCILFMSQICEGVAYMHSQSIVHLDLKPENIMCHTRTSHEIKIIDFGLAQKLLPDTPVRVLFGTPEFIPPEIINYEPIGVESDMWSVGVICYVLLSGLSPFMGDNDAETFANITRADYDFDDESFNTVSQSARDFISALLVKRKEDRLSAKDCMRHTWLDLEKHQNTVILSTDKLKKFIIRRKWQKTGNAIRALGRMATLSASRRNSANSNPTTPRPSISGNSLLRMSSVNEEDTMINTSNIYININNNNQQKAINDITDDLINNTKNNENTPTIIKEIRDDVENNKIIRTRACSERSDSGISDCSSHLTSSSCSCTSTPLLSKKFLINEEPEYQRKNIENQKCITTKCLILTNQNSQKNENITQDNEVKINDNDQKGNEIFKINNLNNKLNTKLNNFSKCVVKNKPVDTTSSLKHLPFYTFRSVAKTIERFNQIEKIFVETPKNYNNLLNIDNNKKKLNENKNKIIINNNVNQQESSKIEIDNNLIKTKPTTHSNKYLKTSIIKSPQTSSSSTSYYHLSSPSLIKKIQPSTFVQEQNNENYLDEKESKLINLQSKFPCLSSINTTNSNNDNKNKSKVKNESF